MDTASLHGMLRLFSHVVLALMAVAIAYGAWIALRYWSGIGV